MKFLYTIFLALALNGAQPVWNPSTHAIVDCAAGEWDKAAYLSIQKALDSGATWIEVRPCVYDETLTIATQGVTIEAQGAVLLNDGLSTSISINAPSVTIRGDLTIQGTHDGSAEGDFFQGVGVSINAPYAAIEGLRTVNLRSFSLLCATADGHHTRLSDFDFRNVGTDAAAQVYAPKAVMFINGCSHNTVQGGYISGFAQGVGTWYGASYNTVTDNRLERNYGYVGNGNGYVRRSAVEDYGVPGAANTGNRFVGNRIDGARNSGFELADVLSQTVVSGNEVRNVGSGFVVMGSGDNRGRNITIEGNTFYGDGADDTNWFSGSGAVRGNTFIGWIQDNMGTVHIPPDGLGDVTIEGNTFDGNSTVMRASQQQGALRFTGNRVLDSVENKWMLYFADTTHPAEIAGNVIEAAGPYGVTIASNRNTPLWIHDNTLVGGFTARQGTVEGNTISNPYSDWSPLYVQNQMVVRNNRIASNPPLAIEGSANGALIERNYWTLRDGAAWSLPACPPAVRCAGNWTAGETPP